MATKKVNITTRITVGSKAIFTGSKLHEPSASVKVAIDMALDKAAAEAERRLIFESVSAHQSEVALEQRGTIIDNDDLHELTVENVCFDSGRFLKVVAVFDGAPGVPTALPSGLQIITQTQQQQLRALPTQPSGERYDFRLFQALFVNLKAEGLSFPLLDAEHSGKRMLTALLLVLQYLLPFDDFKDSPLRLAGRVHLVVPERFKTESLNKERPSEVHHGEKKT